MLSGLSGLGRAQDMTKILVVEDDPDVSNLVQHWLKKAGYEVVSTDSGEAALEMAPTQEIDLAVLDVGLPGMTGLELLDRLRATWAKDDFPAIFLSARVEGDDVKAGESQGALYLTKPFRAATLIDAVNTVVSNRSL